MKENKQGPLVGSKRARGRVCLGEPVASPTKMMNTLRGRILFLSPGVRIRYVKLMR